MTFLLWIDGRFSLTNKMLSNLRAAEKFHGRRPKNWRDLYAEETAAIRLAAKRAAVTKGFVVPRGHVCSLGFTVFGHHRHDPDAWYLLGKAIVDGLADAGSITQDRTQVWDSGGRVAQSQIEEAEVAHVTGWRGRLAPGVLVQVVTFERPEFAEVDGSEGQTLVRKVGHA